MNAFYTYKVKYYNNCSNANIIAAGLTFGESWADVMQHLIDTYGEDELTDILEIHMLDYLGDCIENEDIKLIKEEE